ncbi:glycosyltransferase family 25 protein [Castellaniella denitrificans]|uniref:glycosyltransferase family 25 protein n=1 Tax=Castellaniella denitrificans TaxID=56119 RepID=UPI001ACE2C18|nr:glycosyltransferase family 25 protein [Burkholderiales bacterium]
MNTIPIRVISLASRTDRRQQIAAQFDRLGVTSYTFFDAVNGKTQPDHPLFSHYDPVIRERRKGRGRDLKPSQLGCFASHYLLWQECVESGQPTLIIEDDAILLDGFTEMLAQAATLVRAWPLIWLHGYEPSGRDPVMEVGRVASFTLVRKLKRHSCTVAYLLTPAGAATLLEHCQIWIYPVDDTMVRFYEHGVESILLQPLCVAQDQESPSDIRGEENPPMPLTDKARREVYKVCDGLRLLLHNLRFRLRFRRSVP